jgi:ArsR family transcriptional regulator
MSDTTLLPEAFRLLGDPVRWRLLRLLSRERLNASELTRILSVAQSGVSRHLRLLKDGGLVHEQRRGGWAWYMLPAAPPAGLSSLWEGLRARLGGADGAEGDDARLAEVLRERAEQAEGWAALPAHLLERHRLEPGRSWAAWAQALGRLLPPLEVVHLGCGAGALTREVARWAGHVVAVDDDPRALAQARASFPRDARPADGTRVRFVRCPLTRLALPDAGFDLALLAQSLGPVEHPETALSEAARVVRPGGAVLVLDLLPHREAWVRERLGHLRQGVAPALLTGWLAGAGLSDIRVEPAARRRGDPFVVLVGSARRPACAAEAVR